MIALTSETQTVLYFFKDNVMQLCTAPNEQ